MNVINRPSSYLGTFSEIVNAVVNREQEPVLHQGRIRGSLLNNTASFSFIQVSQTVIKQTIEERND